jgi:hypothetical protein
MMRRYLNVSRRIRNVHHSLSEFMFSKCGYLVCNSIYEYSPPLQNRQFYINCHIDRLNKDGLFDRNPEANVYHY